MENPHIPIINHYIPIMNHWIPMKLTTNSSTLGTHIYGNPQMSQYASFDWQNPAWPTWPVPGCLCVPWVIVVLVKTLAYVHPSNYISYTHMYIYIYIHIYIYMCMPLSFSALSLFLACSLSCLIYFFIVFFLSLCSGLSLLQKYFPGFSIPHRKYKLFIPILVGGLGAIFYVPIYWECHHPNWLSYFSEGWPNHQPVFNINI